MYCKIYVLTCTFVINIVDLHKNNIGQICINICYISLTFGGLFWNHFVTPVSWSICPPPSCLPYKSNTEA